MGTFDAHATALAVHDGLNTAMAARFRGVVRYRDAQAWLRCGSVPNAERCLAAALADASTATMATRTAAEHAASLRALDTAADYGNMVDYAARNVPLEVMATDVLVRAIRQYAAAFHLTPRTAEAELARPYGQGCGQTA